jgi:hypothetical protein
LALASKSNARRLLSRGNAAALIRRFGAAPGPIVALGHQQLREEPAVGHLIAGRGLGEVTELAADGGQAQQPASGIDRRVGGLFGEPSMTGHGRIPSAV